MVDIVPEGGCVLVSCCFDENTNYLALIKTRLRDQYIQDWNATLQVTSKLSYYNSFKNTFGLEEYINKINNDALRKQFTCFRLCLHHLEIEFGRFAGINRENRLCKLCIKNVIESEYHFLLCCPHYYNIRRKYFNNTSWPSLNMFNKLMSSNNKQQLNSIYVYSKEVFKLRKNTLQI